MPSKNSDFENSAFENSALGNSTSSDSSLAHSLPNDGYPVFSVIREQLVTSSSTNSESNSSFTRSVHDACSAPDKQQSSEPLSSELLSELWRRVQNELRMSCDSQVFHAYIEPLRLISLEGLDRLHGLDKSKIAHSDSNQLSDSRMANGSNTTGKISAAAVISAPTRFHRIHVEEKYKDKISTVLLKLASSEISPPADATNNTTPELNIIFTVESLDAPNRSNLNTTGDSLSFDRSSPSLGQSGNNTPFVVVKKLSSPLKTSISTVAAATSGRNAGSVSFSSVSFSSAGFSSGLLTKYTFDNFVVGDSNQFCHAAAMQVAEKPGLSYNPLFIYGGVGLGKTHLLHAIGNYLLSRNPSAKIIYSSSESFTNELVQALRHGKMDEMKNKLRAIDLLLIDDIQFMSGKERTQEEFFHTFNAIYNAKNQIVITSDKLPQEIGGLEERLQTRFSWGLIADIQAPEFETRLAILKRRCFQEGIDVDDQILSYVAENISSNIRELEGALTKLQAVASLRNTKLTFPMAQTALANLVKTKKISLTIASIKKAVAYEFGIKLSDLSSKVRTRNISLPRHIAMYLCRKHTTSSYPEIGSEFGGRDHSSVIHAASVVAEKIKVDKEFKQKILAIELALLS